MEINLKYVKIDSNKIPKNSLDISYTFGDIVNDENVAVLVTEPYVVLDLDNMDHFNCLYEIVNALDIKCRVMKTDRGGHFWFKSVKPLSNNVGINTPITLKVDVKSWGYKGDQVKKSLCTIKKDGVWRTWLKEDENVDELPFWLTPIKYKKDLFDLKNGDGRDPELFSYIIPLLNQGFNKEQIREIFEIINRFVFADPLKENEIDKMFDDNEIFEKKDLHFFKGRQFLHNNFVDWLTESYFFKSYSKQVYLYKDGLYINDEDEIKRKMIEQIPSLTVANMKEAMENLRLRVTLRDEKIDTLKINLRNGIYDLETNTLLEHSPYIFTINQLDCLYDKMAYNADVDKMLNNVCENNQEIRSLIEQMLGYILIGDCRYQKAFILLGQGANGKSKFLEMVMEWLGLKNCSSLALEDLSEKFRTSQLVGKLANIGDDSGGDLLKNTAIFKKIVTGDSITVENKHSTPFMFNNKSKMLFSANNLPPSTDKSDGFFRRIIIIPFRAVFKKDSASYDPNIIDKVTTQSAKSYLLNLAIKGANMLLENKGFVVPESVAKLTEMYEVDNNSALQWIESNSNNIVDRTQQEVYTDYVLYCDSCNITPMQIRKFNNEIIKRFSYEVIFINNSYIWKKLG